MKFGKIALFGITSIASLNALANSAHAGWWKMGNYQGPVCIYGNARGNVNLKWGDWSHSFNGNKVRQEAAFNYDTVGLATDSPISLVVRGGLKIFSEADKAVSGMQPYNVELSSNYGNGNLFVSDQSAKVMTRACGSTFMVRR